MKNRKTAWFASQVWAQAEDAWDVLAKELNPEQYLEITYEEFVSDTSATLQQICNFIEVPYDESMLNFAKKGSYFQRPDPKFLGLWRSRLSNQEIRLAEAYLSERLVNRGYSLSNLPRLKVTPLDRLFFKAQEVVFGLNTRMRYFGFRLVMLDLISRRLVRSPRLAQRVRWQMNQIVDARLMS